MTYGLLTATLLLGLGIYAHSQAPASQAKVTYKEVDQIFKQRCMPCHSEQRRAWGMDLSSYKGLMAGSNNGEVVKVGNSAKSQLVIVIKDTKGLRMPKNGRSLTAKQIETIARWIDEGAKNE